MADTTTEIVEAQDHHPVQSTEPSTIFAVIADAARNPDVDVEKMRMLLDMKREEEDRDANRAFNRAFVAAKREIQPIFRNQHNSQTNSNYADSFALADQIDPILSKHGLAPSFGTEPCDRDGFYRMVCDLMHEDGHEKRYTADIPIDAAGIKGVKNKTETHAFGSSTTYGRRYMKLSMFDIATRDDDGNKAGKKPVELINTQQVEIISDKLKLLGRPVDKFCAYMKVQKLDQIPAKTFHEVTSFLDAQIEKMERV